VVAPSRQDGDCDRASRSQIHSHPRVCTPVSPPRSTDPGLQHKSFPCTQLANPTKTERSPDDAVMNPIAAGPFRGLQKAFQIAPSPEMRTGCRDWRRERDRAPCPSETCRIGPSVIVARYNPADGVLAADAVIRRISHDSITAAAR